MKNFFKKLSFVMALAMVLTALAPAVAGADASYIYKRGNDTQKEALEVYFGDADEKRDLNVKINGKKTTDGVWKIGNKKIATIDENGVVTPVKNGTTTAKFTAEDGTAVKVKVVVGTRAAGIKVKDNGTAITELAMTVGEEKELKFGAYISKKAKNAGATKSSQDVAFTVEGEAVTTAQDGKYVTVTAAKAGEATITFTAGKKTTTLTVNVIDALAAKQTGANKITVTGSELTDKAADYVVKRGNVTLSIKDVKVNEAKTEAVITSASSTMPKGDYTLSFKGSDAVAFTVETAVVAEIVIDPEVAIQTATNKAVAYFKVLNQFGEDVTSGALGQTVVASGSDSPVLDFVNKKVTFTAAAPYTLNLSQVSLALVCNTNGVNVTKVLTVGEAVKLASVEFAGIYKLTAGKYAPATLAEAMTGLTDCYLFFKGADQYGLPYAAVDGKLQVNVLSTTGLTVGAASVVNHNYVNYIAYNLTLAAGYTTLGAGNVSVMSVNLNNGTTTNDTFTVAAAKKVDTLTVTDVNGVYGGQLNVLGFEALDAEGNPITDYATLSVLNNEAYIKAAGVSFGRNRDGSATLYYQAPNNNSPLAVPTVLTFMTPTNKFSSANISIQPNCVPKAIIGIDATKVLGAVSGNSVVIEREDLIFQDQYGNVMSDTATALNAVTLQAVVTGNTGNFTSITNASGSALSTKDTTVVAANTVTATTTGAVTATVSIQGVAGSDFTFTMYSVALNDMTSFEVASPWYPQHAGAEVDLETVAGTGVYGFYNGVKVKLNADMYEVIDANKGTSVTAPAINAAVEGYVTKDATVNVLIHNAAATIVTGKYQYSNTFAKTTLSVANPYVANSYYYTGTVNATSVAAVTAGAIKAATVIATTQYGETSTSPMYITYSAFPVNPAVCVVTANGTTEAEIEFFVPGYYAVNVKYTTLDGAELEQVVTFNVQ